MPLVEAASSWPYIHELDWPTDLTPIKNIDDDGSMAEPFEQYAWMRKNAPAARLQTDGEDVWMITRYVDVRKASRTPDVFSSQISDGVQPTFLTLFDGQEHARLRHVYAAAFNPKSIALVEDRVRQRARSLVETLVADGSGDVVEGICIPLTMATIGGIMDVPSSDIPKMKFWSNELLKLHAGNRGLPTAPSAAENTERFFDYLQGRLDQLYVEESDSVGGHLAKMWKNGRITAKEAREMCAFLFMAGHDTTSFLIANGVRELIAHQDLLMRIRSNPDDSALFVEELARLRGPVHRTVRRLKQDATVSGVRIPAGALVRLVIASANRDESKFPRPDEFDIDRDTSGHLGFGFGVHSCIGAPLARLESRALFEALSARVDEIKFLKTHLMRLSPGHSVTLGPTELYGQVVPAS